MREIARRQRRRLSLAPEKVGDTTASVANANAPGSASPHDEIAGEDGQAKSKEVLYIRVAHYSKKGVVPYNLGKVNQDRFLVQHSLAGDPGMSVFGVMDGHGEFGHLVAEFVKQNITRLLELQDIRADPPRAILQATKRLCSALQDTGINIAISGTTSVIGLKVDEKLYIANLGDSRCVLARRRKTDEFGDVIPEDSANITVEAVPLTRDHKPDVPEEKARILEAGGRVCPLPGLEDEDCGPDRVWLEKVDVPGLAMSRSIGDEVAQQVGVISVPEITEHDISREDLFAVFASDGVWEFVSNEQAVATVYQHLPNLGDATRSLVNLSIDLWRQHEQVIDDITTVIVQFNVAAST
jgi:serine/threonine protein phosphatase PrpC